MVYFKESYIVLGGSRCISGSFDLRASSGTDSVAG